jgi:Icc-related predicted phosphoesterase
MKLVLISDPHENWDRIQVPDGDILICAGDLTYQGTVDAFNKANDWFGTLKHRFKHILVTAGNHDWLAQESPGIAKLTLSNATLLLHEPIEIDGVKFFLSPYSPEYNGWAFPTKGADHAARLWSQIPDDTQVLVVHGPPHGFGDKNLAGESVGCKALLQRILEIRPEIVVSGHIHEGYGIRVFDGIYFANASLCNSRYLPVNAPIIIDVEPG